MQDKVLLDRSFNGDARMVTYVLAKGASIEFKQANGWTALIISCMNGHLEVVCSTRTQAPTLPLIPP